ncbi:MAG: adenylate/guanylate cyclase domain-containing protein [Gaiellales bacterium]
MNCPACGAASPEGASFCGACGAPLSAACPKCGASNPPANRFCAQCGSRIGAEEAPTPAGPHEEGQRRHLTVMFCDLADSTRLAERLDPEDMREVVRSYQSACVAVLERFDGYIAHYLGDGILAYFGYPQAHEDDAVLAVRAGLAITEAVPQLRWSATSAEELAVRVGIHTGLAVIADMGAGEQRQRTDVVGETPNIAARLQSMAGRNEVVVSGSTHLLAEGFFVSEPLGQLELKGISRPVPAYRVRGVSSARTRLDVVAGRGFTPLVGRKREMELLGERWEQAKAGEGQVVFLCGEPGIGKSRLVHELRERAGADGGFVIQLEGSVHHEHSMLHPLIEHLRRALDLHATEDDDAALRRVERLMDVSGVPRAEGVPPIADLLGIPYDASYPIPTWSPEARKRRTLETLTRLLIGLTTRQPVLVVAEDMQWMDPTTLELLGDEIGAEPIAGLLTVVTHRPEFSPAWPEYAHVARLTLNRLSLGQVDEIVQHLTHDRHLPAHLKKTISERTDGIPLFVEELTQTVLEGGTAEVSGGTQLGMQEEAIPAKLRDWLMARLDRLGPASEVAQLAAAIGREVPYELLQAVSERDEASLQADLARLVEAGLLYRRGALPAATFTFKHALIHDVAYDSLLRSTRQQLHRAIAGAIETSFPDLAADQPEVVARHCAAGGLPERAIRYLHQAGKQAIARSAHLEAIGQLSRALELVPGLPAGQDRDQTELDLLITMGAPLTSSRGYSAPEVEETYTRAHQLCESLHDDERLFGALYGMFRVHMLRAEYTTALDLGNRLAHLASMSGRPALSIAAHRALGATRFYVGDDPSGALAYLETAIRLHEERGGAVGEALKELNDVADPVVTCRAYAGWILWLLNRREEARAMSDRAIADARQLGHPFTLALALCFDAWLCQFSNDTAATKTRAGEALAFSTEQEFRFWIGWAATLEGWTRVRQGEAEAGIAQMRQGLVDWQATGSQLGKTYFLILLADGLGLSGRPREALNTLDEALRLARETGEGFCLPELHRFQGELLLTSGDRAGAEEAIRLALEVAREQGSVTLEARAHRRLSALAP